jgi:myosin-1
MYISFVFSLAVSRGLLMGRYLQQAMNVVGLSSEEQNNIFRMIAAILWLGNVQFVEDDGSGSQVTDTGVTASVEHTL